MIPSGDLWIRYWDETEFLVDAAGTSVFASWPKRFTIDDALVYLLGPVFGILLRLRGRVALHASVVEVGSLGLAFIGPAGAGKSTIAASFAGAGHAVLSDDLLALTGHDGRFFAEPGYSTLRLWPDAVRGLYGPAADFPRLAEGWEKRYTDLSNDVFCGRRVPVGCIYVIEERVPGMRNPSVRSLNARQALERLIVDSYTGRYPGARQRRDEFELLSRLVSEVPVRGLQPGRGWDSLAELPGVVTRDFAELTQVA